MIETSRSFRALREEFVEVTLRHDPVAATMAGIHDYDHQLPDVRLAQLPVSVEDLGSQGSLAQ